MTVPQDEDCLNVNVIVPANVTAGSKLPVVIVSGGVRLMMRKELTVLPAVDIRRCELLALELSCI